ncbi:MAG: flagellar motor switch protein FliN [Phycisphaerales bacterium]|nr:flagellar motor switch protein FliN [Phycisphaerales bacterium]MCB9857047.1 flagellar motor switch protein FliN [Phycisphaerales bacterium]MCB9861826.1 flagellar motor switch protein FliN [Phycisphaerales bacterium]
MAAAAGDVSSEDAGAAGELSQADIDAAMAAAATESADTPDAAHELTNPDGTPKLDSQGRPFDEAAAMMAAAIEEERAEAARAAAAAAAAPKAAPPPQAAYAQPAPLPPPPAGAVPLDIPDFGGDFDLQDAKGIGLLNDVQLDVRIELGRSDLYIEDVLKLGKGAVVELDRLAGDPVDVIVNDRLVARGEVLVLNDNFCVRISEILVGRDDG